MFEAGHVSVSGDRVGRYTFLLRVIFLYFIGILFLLYLACVIWTWLVDSAAPLDKQQQEWVQKTAENLRITLAKDAPEKRPYLVICDFCGEPTGVLADCVRRELGGKTQYIVKDRTVRKKIRDFLHLLPQGVSDLKAAAELAKEQGAELALIGNCTRLTYDEYGKLDTKVVFNLVNLDGKSLKEITFVSGKSAEKAEAASGEKEKDELSTDAKRTIVTGGSSSLSSPEEFTWQKFLGWVFFVLLFPILTIQFLILMTRKESNFANAMILIIYTIIDGVLAWFLFAAAMYGWGVVGILLIIVLVVCALIYNLQITAFARKIGEEA